MLLTLEPDKHKKLAWTITYSDFLAVVAKQFVRKRNAKHGIPET